MSPDIWTLMIRQKRNGSEDMKYIVVLGDGMAGRPLEELEGKTTLEPLLR